MSPCIMSKRASEYPVAKLRQKWCAGFCPGMLGTQLGLAVVSQNASTSSLASSLYMLNMNSLQTSLTFRE
ncbi:hypothetical protein E5D57_008517 [Metarhizium anisopliae]|nr:hypothetical protein E5D57_008517 [Metarhizium anisopliae]